MIDPYYKPNQINYNAEQILWLIPHLPYLRVGLYPQDSTSTGYSGGSSNVSKQSAPGLAPKEIAAELDWRIQQAGVDGLFLEMTYSTDDRLFTMHHIAQATNCDINEIDKSIHKALHYISGFRRKGRSYKDWKGHRRGK